MMLCTQANSCRTIDAFDGDTATLHSRWLARLAVVRLLSAGAGLGLETKRSPWIRTRSLQQQSVSQSVSQSACWLKMFHCAKRTKYHGRLNRVHSARRQPASARRAGSDAWCGALARCVSSRHHTTATVGLSVCSNLCTHDKSVNFV